MRYLFVILIPFSVYGATIFDRAENPYLYDEVQVGRKGQYSANFAPGGGGGGSSGPALAEDAQLTYDQPGFFSVNHIDIDDNFRIEWVGDAEDGYIRVTDMNGDSYNIHPPEDAELLGGDSPDDFQMSYSWGDEDATYEFVFFKDGFLGVYERLSDSDGWIFESHVEGDSLDDLPDEVLQYIDR